MKYSLATDLKSDLQWTYNHYNLQNRGLSKAYAFLIVKYYHILVQNNYMLNKNCKNILIFSTHLPKTIAS